MIPRDEVRFIHAAISPRLLQLIDQSRRLKGEVSYRLLGGSREPCDAELIVTSFGYERADWMARELRHIGWLTGSTPRSISPCFTMHPSVTDVFSFVPERAEVATLGQQPDYSGWISMKARLPTKSGYYLATSPDCPEPGAEVMWFDYAGGWLYSSLRRMKNVTHWMPLPAPPEDAT